MFSETLAVAAGETCGQRWNYNTNVQNSDATKLEIIQPDSFLFSAGVRLLFSLLCLFSCLAQIVLNNSITPKKTKPSELIEVRSDLI